MTLVTAGLQVPESPLIAPNGDIVLAEVRTGRILRIRPDGRIIEIAKVPGRSAAIAVGPDGAIYVANLGTPARDGMAAMAGRIQRIDLATRAVTDVLTQIDGVALLAPDDLVFDAHGGFYFTDIGSTDRTATTLPLTGIYYCRDGSARRVTEPSLPTNGIDLSPDGSWLYWTEYRTGRLYGRKVGSPGVLIEPARPRGDCLYSHPAPLLNFDSLRVDATGAISIAAHEGFPTGNSAILSFDPTGRLIGNLAVADPAATSLAISTASRPVAYLTLRDRLVRVRWPRRGQAPRYQLATEFWRDPQ